MIKHFVKEKSTLNMLNMLEILVQKTSKERCKTSPYICNITVYRLCVYACQCVRVRANCRMGRFYGEYSRAALRV